MNTHNYIGLYDRRKRNRASNLRRLKHKWAKRLKHHGLTLQQWRERQAAGGIQKAVMERVDTSWRATLKKRPNTRRNDKSERRDRR